MTDCQSSPDGRNRDAERFDDTASGSTTPPGDVLHPAAAGMMLVAATLGVMTLGIAVSTPAALGQNGATGAAADPTTSSAPADPPAARVEPDADVAAPSGEPTVQFNFKDTTYGEVVNFFSRATGLPVINEVDPPGGTLTYFAPEPYSLSEGLRILNIILQTKQVTLRREGEFLYLGKLDKSNHGPVYVRGEIPGDVTDDELITVLVPLENVTANELAERLKGLVGSYGGLTSIPQQNSLLITETAGNCRRLQAIVSALDTAGDYQDKVKIYPVKNAKADQLLGTLKVLMSERVVKYVINQQGQQVKLEEDDLGGLRIEADKRTNAIIAKGPDSRLQSLADMIEMLDVAEGSSRGDEMTTINLARITSEEANTLLGNLYGSMSREQRPIVIPLNDVNKITVIGNAIAASQAVALLSEVDGGGTDGAGPNGEDGGIFSQSTAVVPLQQATAESVQRALPSLITPRQDRLVRRLSAPDGKSIILAGPSNDVSAVRELIETLDDTSSSVPREVRLIRLDVPAGVQSDELLQKTEHLYGQQVQGDAPENVLSTAFDRESNIVTLIGSREAVERWQKTLSMVESTVSVRLTTRQFEVTNAKPSEIIRPVTTLARQLLQAEATTDGRPYTEPKVEAIDELDLLLVTASEDQFQVVERLVQTLDEEQPKDLQFRVIPVRNRDADVLATEASRRYEEQVQGLDESVYGKVQVEVDAATGSLLLTASPEAISRYTTILNQLQALTPPERTLEYITLRNTRPEQVLPKLRQLMEQADPIDPSRAVPAPEFIVVEDMNSLLVRAEPAQHRVVQDLVRRLDVVSGPDVQVRYERIARGDRDSVLEQATQWYGVQVDTADPRFSIEIQKSDTDPRGFTLIGARTAIDRWQQVLREVQNAVTIERETREITLEQAEPSRLIARLRPLADSLLRPVEPGVEYVAPELAAVDELNLVRITATGEQWATLDNLIRTLDEPETRDLQLQVVRVRNRNPQTLVDEALTRYNEQTRDLDSEVYGSLEAEVDNTTGSILLTATRDAAGRFSIILNTLDQIVPPQRTVEFVELSQTKADDILPQLQVLMDAAMPEDPTRETPAPDLKIIPESNTLLITAEASQHRVIRDLVRRLDVAEPGDLPPLRMLQLRTADANQIANVLRTQYDRRPNDQKREMPVNVQADIATNTLIVSAHEALFEDIRSFVEQLNKESGVEAERVTEIYPLKNAKAPELADALNKLYPDPPIPLDRRGTPMPWAREPREVQISFDEGSNSIVVDAPAERIPAFTALVEKLDRIELPPQAEMRTYPIRRADIRTIEQTLSRLAREGSLSEPRQGGAPSVPVSITAEPVSNTLIVTGDATTFDKVEQLLEELQAVPIERELRIIRITNADPQDVADQAITIYDAQTQEVPDAQPVDVQIDRTSNSLMVIAEPKAIARFIGIINQLEQNILGPDQEVNLIPLEHADAAEVVDFLRDLAQSSRSFQTTTPGPQPAFEVIERTNSVLVAAQPAHYQLIRSLIRELDVLDDQDLPPVRILQVETADAPLLASTLAQVYNSRPADQRTAKPVSIRADANLNALLVSAHPEPFEEINRIVTELNETRTRATSGREIRIFPLSVARAEELARTLDQMFPDPPIPLDSRGRPLYHLRGTREVVVRGDAQTNSIIVDAPVERMAGFEELVRQLDTTEVAADTEIRTYPIAHADLNAVRGTINELITRGALSSQVAGRRNVPITVSTEPTSQTLIVGGPVDIFPEVERILNDLDARPDRPATVMKFYKLKSARADRVVDLLREVLVTRMETEFGELRGIDLQSLLDITSDAKTNTIIISAPESMVPVTEALIEQLDSAAASLEDPTIRIVPLTFADAASVARTLQTTLPSVISKSTREPIEVRIVPSDASNALVLVGTSSDLDEVVALIEPLDARPGIDSTIAETFALEHAEAETIAPVVQRLLVDQQRMDPRLMQLTARYRWLEDSLRRAQGTIRVEPDARTNSLIVSGPQATVALAGTLIQQLDSPGRADDNEIVTFTPKKADPRRLSQTVSRILASRQGSRASRVELIADGPSGSIVGVGPESAVADAMAMLAQFDDDTPELPETDLQLFRLNFADPGVVMSTLSRVLRDESRWPESLRSAMRAGVAIAQPSVTSEPNSGRLLVSAPRELMPLAREVISQFDTDQRDTETAREFRVFNLVNAQAASVATTLREMINVERGLAANVRPGTSGPGRLAPHIAAEGSTNTLVVSAIPEDMAMIEEMIKPLDEGASLDQQRVRTIYLEHARADRVAPIIEQLLRGEQLTQWIAIDLMRRGQQLPDLGPDVRVAAETRLNAVIVSAPASVLTIAEELARQLDVDAADEQGQRPVRVIALRQTDARQMLTNLQALFADDEESGERPPVMRVDQASNSLIIRATDPQFVMIDTLVTELEDATLFGSRQVRLIPVDRSRASAAQTAETLRRLLQQRSGVEVEVISVDELIRRQDAPSPSPSSSSSSSTTGTPSGASAWPLGTPAAGPGQVASDAGEPQAELASRHARSTESEDAGFTADCFRALDTGLNEDAPPASSPLVNRMMPHVRVSVPAFPHDPLLFHAVGGPSVDVSLPTHIAIAAALTGVTLQEEATPTDSAEPETDDPASSTSSSDASGPAEMGGITIAVDEATNSLVVIGSPYVTDLLNSLVDQIVREIPPLPARVRYVTLNDDVEATVVATLVNQTLSALRRSGSLTDAVSVVPDRMGGGLIVSANEIDFATIGSLVAAINQPGEERSVMVKVFPLTSVPADRVERSLRWLSTAGDGAGRGRGGRQAQRMREVALTLVGAEGATDEERSAALEAVINPDRISVTTAPGNDAIIVSAPADAFPVLDQFISLLDQSPTDTRTATRRFAVDNADVTEISRTLQQIFTSRFQADRRNLGSNVPSLVEARFYADRRTSTIYVTGTTEQFGEIEEMLASLDAPLSAEAPPLTLIEVEGAQPSRLARIIDQVVIGQDPGRRERTSIVPDDASQLLLVRAEPEELELINRIVSEVDRFEMKDLPIRAIKLSRADADQTARALLQFFDDRARISQRPGQPRPPRQISVVGDRRSGTVFVAANDEDFAEVENLINTLDAPSEAEDLQFQIVPLRHARAAAVSQIIESMGWQLIYGSGRGRGIDRGQLSVQPDERTNSIIVSGSGESFAIVEQIVRSLDVPAENRLDRAVRVVMIENGDTNLIARAARETFTSNQPSWWWDQGDDDEVRIISDPASKTLILSGLEDDLDPVVAFVTELDSAAKRPDQKIEIIDLQHARANVVAASLTRFFRDRARVARLPEPAITISPAPGAEKIVISATESELALINDLLQEIDVSVEGDDRRIELYVLENGRSMDAARTIQQLFPNRGVAADQMVTVTSDARTNSLVISAPGERMSEIEGVIAMVDAPQASEERIIRTFALTNARADEAAAILTEVLNLSQAPQSRRGRDLQEKVLRFSVDGLIGGPGNPGTEGEDGDRSTGAAGPAVEMSASITPSLRNNALIVVAAPDSMPLLATLIAELDEAPAVSVREYRVYQLDHAVVDDVRITLNNLLRAQQARGRGGASDSPPNISTSDRDNTLVIAATVDQHKEIESILKQIDIPSRVVRKTEFVQIENAEATNVADALDVFYGPWAREADSPAKKNVSIVPDPASNSLVISAEESVWEGLLALVEKLDAEDYDSSLRLEVVALQHADARSVANAISEAFAPQVQGGGNRGANNRRGGTNQNDQNQPQILVDDTDVVRAAAEPVTNSIVVSASRRNMEKIRSIVEQLDVADYMKLPPARLIRLTEGNAEAVAVSIRELYAEGTQGRGSAVGRKSILITSDSDSNTIIVRAEDDQFEQIETLARALEETSGQAGVSVRVIGVGDTNATRIADAVRQTFALTARERNEPFFIQPVRSSNTLIVASSERLFTQVEEVVAQLDTMGPGGSRQIYVVPLENIAPDEMKRTLESLNLHRETADGTGVLSEPITITVLEGRQALAVLANPADRERLLDIIGPLDAAPEMGSADVRLVLLKQGEANVVANMLLQLLQPGEQHANTAMANAVREQIRRLRMHRAGVNGGGEIDLDLTKPIRILPAASINAIVISSTPANCNALEELARMFDELPVTDAVMVRIFPLTNIAARSALSIVGDLFSQGRNLRRQPGTNIQGEPASEVGTALLDQPAMTIDERTNTLIVAGREEAVAFVEVLLGRLDNESAARWVEPQLIALEHADAEDLARTLDAVLVRGVANTPQASALQTQVGRLKIARERGNAGQGGDVDPSAFIAADLFVPMSRLIIQAEPKMNALLVVGTPENLAAVTELTKMLDVPEASPASALRIYALKHASAGRVATIVNRLFDDQIRADLIRDEDRVIIQPDERTNSLIVTTTPRSFAVLEPLLDSLDTQRSAELNEIRVMELTNASAAQIAPMVQQLMDSRLERLRRVEPELAELQRVLVIADNRTNALLITAGRESYEVIEEVVQALEASSGALADSVEIIPLERTNASSIASTVQEVLNRQYAMLPPEVARRERPLILTDARSNSLLVSANDRDLAQIRALVDQLEQAPINPSLDLHVIALGANNAQNLAPRLQQLMRERERSLGAAGGRGRPEDRTVIEFDPISNSLIVAASDENLEILKGLIDTLDQAGQLADSTEDTEIITLKSGQADQILRLVEQLYVEQANRERGRDAVRATADTRLNAIIVSASQADIEAIRGLITDLENAQVTQVQEIEIVNLAAASAVETVSLIENVLAGGRRRSSDLQSTVIRFIRDRAAESLEDQTGRSASETEINFAIRESIRLTPDLRTNSVIISAPASSIRLIKELIEEIDTADTGAKRVRIFELENADAIQMAEILSQLFNLRQQGDLYVLRPRDEALGGMGGDSLNMNGGLSPAGAGGVGGGTAPAASFGDTDLIPIPDPRQQLVLTVDPRTNSLLVSGAPRYLDLVAEVVEELDTKTGASRIEEVYPLKNARAQEVAEAVGTFLTQEQERVLRTLGAERAGSIIQQLEREVSVVGFEESNSLMISASPRYMDRIRDIISELDKAPPQVLISVMLAEVTLDSDDQYGVNLGFGTFTGQSIDFNSSFGLEPGAVSGLGVPNLSVSADDFNLLIRALQAQGRLEVLSRPHILVNNNQEANFQVGQDIFIPVNVRVLDNGGTTTDVEPRDIGIILNVIPSISPDRFVRMEVSPEISSLSARTTQVSEDFEVPIIDKRIISTVVTVKDGQTVVIGGLFSDRSEVRYQKVPGLSAIPIVGELFRSRLQRREKTELLVVITPHIIETPEDAARFTDVEVENMTLPPSTKMQLREGEIDARYWEFPPRDKRWAPEDDVILRPDPTETGDASSSANPPTAPGPDAARP